MDPASAIGVSSAVLTFVDFGFKIVRGAVNMYGATDSTAECMWSNPHDVAEKMKLLAFQMQPPTTSERTYKENELCDLAVTCQALAKELSALFQKIQPKDSKSKRQCIWAATKLLLKEDQITGLEKRLEACRSQFEVYLLQYNCLIVYMCPIPPI